MQLSREEISILKQLHAKAGTGNVMEFLHYDSSRFDEGFTIANQLQNKDAIKLLYSNFNRNEVIVEITLPGKKLAGG